MGIDPVVLFFVFGLFAGLVKSELKLPPALYETLSIVLLLAIGLHGGVELAEQASAALLGQSLLVPPYAAVAQDKGSKRKRQCDWRAIRALE